MKIAELKNPIAKNILPAIAITGFGFILLNLTFIFDFLFQSLIDGIIGLFTKVDFNMAWHWFPPMKHAMFVVIIGLISRIVFRSKLDVLYKSIYIIVPLAVIFVTLGIFLYRWPVAAYLSNFLFGVSVLYYFNRTKQPWFYYYALILVGLVMLIISLLRIEI